MTTNSFVDIKDSSKNNVATIEKNIHLKSTDLQDSTIQKNSFSPPICSACKGKMQVSEGDVIYGDRWYHNSCWKEIQKLADMISQ